MNLRLSLVLDGIDRATGPVRRVQAAVAGLSRATRMQNLSKSFGEAQSAVAGLGLKLGAVGGIAGFLFKTQLIDVASQFEQFEAVLTTLEGSADKARSSFGWIREFAKKTPYEVTELTEAFVRLRAYGLDPTDGTLTTLGDTSAAMGKDLMMAVEAIADATTGEFERLKEFGIKGAQKGNLARFEYTDRQGQQQFKIVDKSNRKMLQSTLTAIWNEKYAGAMETQSRTWKGMVSNLSDLWTDFRVSIMSSGVFDFLKQRIGGLLELVDKMKASGELQVWAKRISDGLISAFEGVWNSRDQIKAFALDLWGAFKFVMGAVGGLRNMLIAIALVMSAPTISAIVSLASALSGLLIPAVTMMGKALLWLGVTLLTTPVGWFLLAVAAIAGVAYLVKRNWEPIKSFFVGVWQRIKEAFLSTLNAFPMLALAVAGIAMLATVIRQKWEPLKAFYFNLLSAIRSAFVFAFGWLFDIWGGIIENIRRVGAALSWLAGKYIAVMGTLMEVSNAIRDAFLMAFDWVVDRISWLREKLIEVLTLPSKLVAATVGKFFDAGGQSAPALGQPQRTVAAAAAAAGQQQVSGRIGITVTSEGRVRVDELQSRGGIDLDVSTGLTLVTP